MAWTLSRSDALVHGDFSPKNVLVYNRQLILLDHEVLHFGDPAFDIGFSLTHFLSKALHLPQKRRHLSEPRSYTGSFYLDEVRGMPWGSHLDLRAAQHTLGLSSGAGLRQISARIPEQKRNASSNKQIVIEMIEENLLNCGSGHRRLFRKDCGRRT